MHALPIALLLLAKGSPAAPQCPRPTLSDTVQVVRGANVSVALDFIWRDMMSMTLPATGDSVNEPVFGTDLIVALAVHRDSLNSPNLVVEWRGIWARRDSTWWPMRFDRDTLALARPRELATARDGPRWPVGTLVELRVAWRVRGQPERCALLPPRKVEATF